jgi:hypothetical protein
VRSIARSQGLSRATYYRAIGEYQSRRSRIRSYEISERRIAMKVIVALASGKRWTVSQVQQALAERGHPVGRRKAWELMSRWKGQWHRSGLGRFPEHKSSAVVLRFINQLRAYWARGIINPKWMEPVDEIEDYNLQGQPIDKRAMKGRRRCSSEFLSMSNSGGRVVKKPKTAHDWD